MQLISALASGIHGAENGTVEIYQRATMSRATYYTDYVGSNAISTGADIQLDANGGATVYVNQSVDVDVKDVNGVRVRFFTEMLAAPLVEYTGTSFTGTDYDTGATGALKPTTVQQIFDKWYTSSGAVDFRVLVDGSATTLQGAFGSILQLAYFNVKGASYGAVGDGVADDATAVQLAIDAAAAAGGGVVYFPPGVYLTKTELTLPGTVSLLGAGMGMSSIVCELTGALASGITTTTPEVTEGWQTISGLKIYRTGTPAFYQTALKVETRAHIVIEKSWIGAVPGAQGHIVQLTAGSENGTVILRDNYIEPAGTLDGVIAGEADAARVVFASNMVSYRAESQDSSYFLFVEQMLVTGNVFDITKATATVARTFYWITWITNTAAQVVINGNHFSKCDDNEVTVYAYGNESELWSEGAVASVTGNVVKCAVADSGFSPPVAIIAEVRSASVDWDNRVYSQATNIDVILDTSKYSTFVIYRTTNTAQIITLTGYPRPGARLRIIVQQKTTASGTVSWTNEPVGATDFTLLANEYRVIEAVGIQDSATTTDWILVSELTV